MGREGISVSAASASVMARPDEVKKRLPVNLEAAMRRAGLTRSDLAREMGQHRSSVSHYLDGSRAPGMGQMLDMARALSCGIDDLLADVPAPPSEGKKDPGGLLRRNMG